MSPWQPAFPNAEERAGEVGIRAAECGLTIFELASLVFTAAAITHSGKGGEDAIKFGIDNAEEFIRIHTEREAKQ